MLPNEIKHIHVPLHSNIIKMAKKVPQNNQ